MARGRRPDEGEPRDEVLRARVTVAKAQLVDEHLQGQNRSGFLRAAIDNELRARGAKL